MDANQSMDIRRDLVALLPRLRRFALTLLRDPARIDAVVAQACEQAIQKAHVWKGDTRMDVRLFGLVRSTARADEARRRPRDGKEARTSGGSRLATDGRSIIEMLPEECASVFLLCGVEKLSYREAAAVMGGTPEAIAATMVAARRGLSHLAVDTTERRA